MNTYYKASFLTLVSTFVVISTPAFSTPQSIKRQLEAKIASGQVFEALQQQKATAALQSINLSTQATQKIQELVQAGTLNPFDTIERARGFGIDLKDQPYMRERIKQDVRENKYNPQHAIARGGQLGLDLQNEFFPAYWQPFLNMLKGKTYPELLADLERFSKNTLPGESQQVFADVRAAPCPGNVSSQWVRQISNSVFAPAAKYA